MLSSRTPTPPTSSPHMFIEPDAGIAYYDEKGIMTVIASTQNAHYDRNEVAAMLGVPQNHVRCIQPTTGGGFGGKLRYRRAAALRAAAHYTKRPVKIVRSRVESTMVSSKRHPITTHVKTGATKDGKLVAAQYELTCDAGAYGSYGPAVIGRFLGPRRRPLRLPERPSGRCICLHQQPDVRCFPRLRRAAGRRCPRGADGRFLAEALHMSPLEIRRINGHHVGTTIPTGQTLTESVGYQDTLAEAIKKAEEVMPDALRASRPGLEAADMKLRGTGVGKHVLRHRQHRSSRNPAPRSAKFCPTPALTSPSARPTSARGVATSPRRSPLKRSVLSLKNIHVTWADTQIAPEGGATSASRQTFITGNAVKNACTNAMGELKRTASEFLNVPQEELIFRHREIYSSKDASKKMTYPELMGAMGKNGRLAVGAGYYNPKTTYLNPADMSGVPYEVYSYATCIIEVEVDTDTGEVQLLVRFRARRRHAGRREDVRGPDRGRHGDGHRLRCQREDRDRSQDLCYQEPLPPASTSSARAWTFPRYTRSLFPARVRPDRSAPRASVSRRSSRASRDDGRHRQRASASSSTTPPVLAADIVKAWKDKQARRPPPTKVESTPLRYFFNNNSSAASYAARPAYKQ